MKSIFVSYSRTDARSVMLLLENLRSTGYTVWHDERLQGGQRWWESIPGGIRRCDVVLFAISQASLQSEACTKECSYALSLHKTLISVQMTTDVSVRTLPLLKTR